MAAEHLESPPFRYVLRPDETHEIYSQPETQIDIDEAAAVRTIELSLQLRTAYPLQDDEYHEVDGTTQIGVRNIQFTEAIATRDAPGNTDLQNPTPTRTPTPTPPPTPGTEKFKDCRERENKKVRVSSNPHFFIF